MPGKKRKQSSPDESKFLPMDRKECKRRGWDELDIIIVTGDAYVDHPGFGATIIGRVLEDAGFKVGIIAQPKWDNTDDFMKLGRPRLFFAVTAGNTDSMVSNYTPALKPRPKDMYSPGGKTGLRPNRATVVYSNRLKEAYPDVPIVIGGIEASLRRFAEYDYWSGKVRQSILADAPADLLVYGMGELQTTEIAHRLDAGEDITEIKNISGTAWKLEVKKWKEMKADADSDFPYVELPSYNEVSSDKKLYAEAFRLMYEQQDPARGIALIQPHPKTIIIQNPPMRQLSQEELDHVYELPYTREEHPSYRERVPALEPVKFSITTHRGCFGSCSFCAITQHQGRTISSRSIDSIVREAYLLTELRGFKGNIIGVGGPSANMYAMKCKKWEKSGACKDKLCLYPEPCPSMDKSHKENIEMLRRLREIPGVKNVFVSYGVRYDLALLDPEYVKELCAHHISGQLKIAPEHFSKEVTDCMKKPGREVFEEFAELFEKTNKELDKDQYLVTFLMSGHPACTMEDMIELAQYIKETNRYTEQVQDFTPTPMTAATCMFHTGLDPFTGEKVYVATSRREKNIQRAMMHYRDPRNHTLVYEGLKKAGREDLIGNSWNCLIPRKAKKASPYKKR
ncbi:YgiQ family radical SAM protein [Methanococcoides sp. FTZ1]|uniref:YgiQ family radical SAM protein n=1 Tax=Methanococcoides sp. FTZ1 TaxID=3439061 RepID=UPI003F85F1D6